MRTRRPSSTSCGISASKCSRCRRDERFRQEARRGGHPQLSAVFAGFVVGRCLRQRHLSATELRRPVDDEVGSSASFMPGGTVTFGGGKAQLRFVSVHTTAPIPGYWSRWKRRWTSWHPCARAKVRATCSWAISTPRPTTRRSATSWGTGSRTPHAVGARVHVHLAVQQAAAAAVRRHRHIVLDKDIIAGQMQVKSVASSDHAALLATIVVQ